MYPSVSASRAPKEFECLTCAWNATTRGAKAVRRTRESDSLLSYRVPQNHLPAVPNTCHTVSWHIPPLLLDRYYLNAATPPAPRKLLANATSSGRRGISTQDGGVCALHLVCLPLPTAVSRRI